jgi:YD repeat-containing protein
MTDDPIPARVDGLSLGLGERTGALLVYQTRAARGKTIYAWDAAGRRMREHRAEVQERTVDGRSAWVAVFAGLRAGDYQVVAPWGGQEARVTVASGEVTELDWRAPAPP